jgi:quercetin 2,3-dioxygenase
VHLVRVISHNDTRDFDPFLLLDAFDSRNPEDYIKGFPWHPHRGIETITYLIHGDIEHGDSLGNHGSILDGGCQWMTAGSGIVHQEMPQPSGHMLGFQLWLNLPQKDKMAKPAYHDITKEIITTIEEENGVIRIIGGAYNGHSGPMQGDYVKPDILDVTLHPGAELSFPTDVEKTIFFYIVEGSARLGNETEMVHSHSAVLLDKDTEFYICAGSECVRFVYCAGKPLRESIAWGGPIVMNTREELNLAFKELEDGTFIK